MSFGLETKPKASFAVYLTCKTEDEYIGITNIIAINAFFAQIFDTLVFVSNS